MRRLSMARDAKNDQPDGPRSSILVAGTVCGTGKTTLAQTVEHLYFAADQHLRPATVSFGRSTRRPAALDASIGFTGRGDISVHPDADPADYDPWTQFGNCLAQGGHLIDLEGHLLHDALRWVERVKPRALLEEVSPLSVVLPVGTSRKSIESTEHALDQLRRVEPIFMRLKIIVAFNCCHNSGFYDTDKVNELRDLVREQGFSSVEIPHGDLSLAMSHSFADLATSGAREFAAKLGISPMAAHTRLQAFRNWLETVAVNMRAIGLVPEAAEITKAA